MPTNQHRKSPADVKSLCRAHTENTVNVLYGIVRSAKVPPGARVQAAAILLDRGWGKAEQSHVGADGGDIQVTIRQIIETAGKKPEEPEGGEGQGI
jgi:hypothetical protein